MLDGSPALLIVDVVKSQEDHAPGGEIDDLDRNMAIRRRVVAELAVPVIAPALAPPARVIAQVYKPPAALDLKGRLLLGLALSALTTLPRISLTQAGSARRSVTVATNAR